MNARWTILLLLGLCGTLAYAAEPAVQSPAKGGDKILIMPLTPLGDASKLSWIGPAIQQNLLAEVSRANMVQAVLPPSQPAALTVTDAASATKAAKDAGAAMVVFGSYQVQGQDLRITASLLDVRTGKVLGGLKANGALQDVFGLEDSLASQLTKLLPQAKVAGTGPAPAPVAALPLQNPAPAEADNTPVPAPTPGNTYPPPYPSPDGYYPNGAVLVNPTVPWLPTPVPGSLPQTGITGSTTVMPGNANRLVDGPTSHIRPVNGQSSYNRPVNGPSYNRPVNGPNHNQPTNGQK